LGDYQLYVCIAAVHISYTVGPTIQSSSRDVAVPRERIFKLTLFRATL